MSLAHWEYNGTKPITHAGPPTMNFSFRGVPVCVKCFHFLFFHNTRGCEANRLSLAYPGNEPCLGPCLCTEAVSNETRERLLRSGKALGFDLAEGNTQAPIYLGKSPDMRLSLPHFTRNHSDRPGRYGNE